jgi:glycosyltransferase involved in cell wall biosynthesis
MFNMRVVVALEAHFLVANGKAHSPHMTYEDFWRRYLEVFDSVLIISRAMKRDRLPDEYQVATGPGVELADLPQFRGSYEFLKKSRRIRRAVRSVLRPDDAIILRVPGTIGDLVWRQITPGVPFGVEVVVDPWDVFAPGGVKSIARPFFRRLFTRNLRRQCHQAVAALYVTQRALQERYPPNKDAYAVGCSDVQLDARSICAHTRERLAAISAIPARLAGDGPPVRLGFIGSFSQAHKLQHVHIEAVARCVARGANVALEMISDGKRLEAMKALARRLGLADRVVFRGRLPGGKPIFDAMDTFDLFLNATAAEGLPRVVIEAMSRGCPCIASDVNGHPELLEPRHLVPPGDPDALARAILRVLRDPKGMTAAVERNIRIAQNYTGEILDARRRQFYQELRERTESWRAREPRHG